MARKIWIIPIVVLLAAGITGCSGNQRSGANEQYNDNARPMGYYSNENHPKNQSGLWNDNDGPLTEMMDHTFGAEGQLAKNQQRRQLQTRDENGNPPNPTVPLASHDQTFFKRDNRFSTGDANYHGQLNQNIANTGFSTDPATHKQLTDQVRLAAEKVQNVRKVRSVIYGSSVFISVELMDQAKAAGTKKAIQKAVSPYVDGRNVDVVTDEGTFTRMRSR
ncbi:YhcN/YlaJ family sporulation lipoprotein [Neobacillus sp. SM06]|uniref:YhcN/YlaJ family sporulation lipoprotein n=1 Tax=Neobacillus sp. SM06 TaxID=3422492 RepID=UPI003D2D93E6